MFYSTATATLIRDLSLEMPDDEKARSGLMFAGGIISSKLEAFYVKHLLPPPEKKIDLFLDCRRIIVRNLALCLPAIMSLIAI